jgi:uncharacterized protein (TIGR02231 family)
LTALLLLAPRLTALAQPSPTSQPTAAVLAQPVAGGIESRITRVMVYPGSATVERQARIAAGSRVISFACLPAALDVQSLQIMADAAVRVGELSVQTLPRSRVPRCGNGELDARIRELELQKDALQAETEALSLVSGYLHGVANAGSTEDAAGKRVAPDAKTVVALADVLRRTGQDALLRQHQITRAQAELERQLEPLVADRAAGQGDESGNVLAVSVNLATASDADVRLSYQISGPSWQPAYRALLDTSTRKLRLERQALVAQTTGEDWRGVKLVLSTGQPRRDTSGRVPNSWRVGLQPPPMAIGAAARNEAADSAERRVALAAAPAPQRMKAQEQPSFEVTTVDTGYTTEFSVPQAVDVPSGGQRVAMTLGQHEDSATLAVRTSPRVDPGAYLIAEIAPPPGVWPAGAMQLYRDGAFVGSGRWNAVADAQISLSFGRDELVRVQVEPSRDNLGSGGFVGSRAERRVQHAYTIENRHRTAIALQVLEAAPVSVDEQVRVTTQFTPQPADPEWQHQPGVVRWLQDLPAGKTTRVAADYTISWPKDARLQEH